MNCSHLFTSLKLKIDREEDKLSVPKNMSTTGAREDFNVFWIPRIKSVMINLFMNYFRSLVRSDK